MFRSLCIGLTAVLSLLALQTHSLAQTPDAPAAPVVQTETTAAIAAAPDVAVIPADPVDHGNTAWMLTSTALVLLMIPGLAMFYGGLVRTKNVLGTMMHSFAAMAIIGVLWAVIGFAIAFGKDVFHGWFGWDSGLLFLSSIDNRVGTWGKGLPDLVFAMFQGKFAIITPALIAGAFAERVRFRGYCLFITLWSLIVYAPLCHAVWAPDGYLFNKGAIDFAGGTVVHISAGVSGLVAALYLGSRRGYPQTAMHPNNLVMTMMGAGLLWVGWFGFNAGSAVSSTLKTAQALTATQVAAAAGAFMWILIEGLRHKKATSLGMASGILAGLVVITPAAGVATVKGAIVLGFLASMICYMSIAVKNRLGYDDSLDVFGIHGIAGISGALLLSFFVRTSDMPLTASGAARTAFQQLAVQAEGVAITIVGSAIISLLLIVLVEKTVGFRMESTEEMAGMDHALHGEHGYGLLNLN